MPCDSEVAAVALASQTWSGLCILGLRRPTPSTP